LSFPGSLDEFHLAERYQGFRKALAPYAGRMEEVPWSDGSRNILMFTRESLATLGPVAGCYVGTEELARIAELLEELPTPIPCVGFSNTDRVRPLLERGAVSAVIDENRYQIGYFAVQKAYEAVLKSAEQTPIASVQMPSSIVFAANASVAADSLGSAFELLVRQRTEALVSYKKGLEEANAKLLDMAVTDALTGLYNRRKFGETLEQEVARALRYGPVSLLMIDLNYFKLVNDRHGHQAGDEALKAVAQVMQACSRTTDTCARLGGDEFALILPHADPAVASLVRQRIQERIAETVVPVRDGSLTLSLSIGLATLPGDAQTADDLIAAADAAMYRAKQAAHSEQERVEQARAAK
jgi:diguanylate cyclase (GGDEF)-like protein